MSNKSNDQGRAFEYAFITSLQKVLNERRPVKILCDSSYKADESAWETLSESQKKTYLQSSEAAIPTIFDLEPRINDGQDEVLLRIQPDSKGEEGDVRDIIIRRSCISWEIGLSLKHNHFAVKHSRLAKSLDFGEKWFGVPCSKQYWADIKPIFDYLEPLKGKKKWSSLPNKDRDVYVPLLKAFLNEMKRSYASHPEIPSLLVEYLMGKFDFYKVISVDSDNLTMVQAYNLRGDLNKPGKTIRPKIIVPLSSLPTRIVSTGFTPDSTNKVEIYLDNGWSFSFRIHNASTKVETSLKFDVQILGVPANILTINCLWQNKKER